MMDVMETETIRRDWTGRVIDGRFTLLEWLGGSDGSAVFLTEVEEDRSRKAAIKLIPADGRDADAQIAEWMARMPLSHPHLMRLFYTGRCEVDSVQVFYAVTEYAEEQLAEILPHRPLTAAEAWEMLLPLLDVLAYLHAKGVVHGRIRPSNIMAVNDQLKLSWDNLHVAANSGSEPRAASIYDAPEEAKDTKAAEIWSLGVTLVEAMTQHPPLWDRTSQSEPLVPESMPEPFAGIARESLRIDPARRCTINEIKARLEPERSLPPRSALAGKQGWMALAAAAIVLIAVIAFAHHGTPPEESQPPAPVVTQPSIAQPATTQPAVPVPAPQPAPRPASGANTTAAQDGIVAQVMPDVPQKALDTIQGRIHVGIRIAVDSSGNVSNAEIESSPSAYFANRALEAARRWKFKPAGIDSQNASREWLLHFEFTQTGSQLTSAEPYR